MEQLLTIANARLPFFGGAFDTSDTRWPRLFKPGSRTGRSLESSPPRYHCNPTRSILAEASAYNITFHARTDGVMMFSGQLQPLHSRMKSASASALDGNVGNVVQSNCLNSIAHLICPPLSPRLTITESRGRQAGLTPLHVRVDIEDMGDDVDLCQSCLLWHSC
uniref:Uncharacterized protein n=1 Tax=Cannabis sativa TaxID=3483 RepID=A0A803PLD8_CANSA